VRGDTMPFGAKPCRTQTNVRTIHPCGRWSSECTVECACCVGHGITDVRMAGMKLWRPRFSVRTLAILVTLVCAYFGAWVATSKHATGIGVPGWRPGAGTPTPKEHGPQYSVSARATSPQPLIIRQDDIDYDETTSRFKRTRRYYLWLLGPKIKLPFESPWDGR
jgi:hypothetical protein